jgi:hypothetical protein
MADFTDSSESLVINIDVDIEQAKKKLKQWNKELASAATDAEKAQKLLSIANSKTFLKNGTKQQKENYQKEIKRIQQQARNLYKNLTGVDVPDVFDSKKVEKNIKNTTSNIKGTIVKSGEMLGDVFSSREVGNKVVYKTQELAGNLKTVREYTQDINGKLYLLSTTITDITGKSKSISGTLVENGKILGKVFSAKEIDNKTVYKTQEIADGIKTIREYAELSNGELYLVSQTITGITEKTKKFKGTLVDSGETLGNQFGKIKVFDDKTIFKTKEFSDGLEIVREYAKLANGELYLMSQNVDKVDTTKLKDKKVKGTKVDELVGEEVLRTDEFDKTKIRTQEIAKGFKTVREYIKLANGELYLMAEKTSEVKKEVKKTFKEKLKDNVFDSIGKNLKKQTKNFGNIFKRLGSIITYRIARTILSAFTNAIKQGFELLSQDNSTLGSIKDTFSSISTTMQVSLTTILIPLFETLANLLKPIADDFLNFANAISYANAKLNGQSQYFELSKEKIDAYTKSLKNSNKQLSELDKFATLNGSSKSDLGGYVDIADASKEIVENQDEYQNIVDFVQTISDIIGVIIKGAKDLFEFVRDNINWLVPAIALVITAMNPWLGFLGSLITLMSDASTDAKLLAAACMTLAGAIIGIGIATHFAKNPLAGLVAGAIGGALFASIFAMIGDVNNGLNPIRAPSLNLSGTSLSGSSDLYSGIESASTRAYSSSGATTVTGDVYIDGVKAGKIMESSVYTEGTRVGHFGGKK